VDIIVWIVTTVQVESCWDNDS